MGRGDQATFLRGSPSTNITPALTKGSKWGALRRQRSWAIEQLVGHRQSFESRPCPLGDVLVQQYGGERRLDDFGRAHAGKARKLTHPTLKA